MPKLMCMTRLSDLPLDNPVTIEPMKAFPLVKDLITDVSWNFRGEEKDQEIQAAPARCAGWNLADGSRKTSIGCRNSGNASSAFFARTFATSCAITSKHDEFIGPRFLIYAAALEMHPLDTEDRIEELREAHGIGYCNITKCCTKVCPENIQITDNAIIPLKERVVDEYYDPLGWIWRMVEEEGGSDALTTYQRTIFSKSGSGARMT